MKSRNPAANCGNCPMWHGLSGSGFGSCHLSPPDSITKVPAASEWCGQHPDFWLEDADMSAPTPDIGGVACVTGCFEAPTEPRAVRLLDAEDLRAKILALKCPHIGGFYVDGMQRAAWHGAVGSILALLEEKLEFKQVEGDKP